MIRTRLMIATLCVAAAACSSSDTLAPTSSGDAVITSDIAMAAADGFAEDVDVMAGMDGRNGNISADVGAYFTSPGAWRPGLTGCTFGGGVFTCPDTLRNGLHVARVVTLKDAAGATEASYDSLLTASINVSADISGDRTHGPWTATVARHRDFTVTGLAGSETSRTVNGTGSETVSQSRVTRNDSTRSYTVAGNSTITNVVFPVRTADGGNGWPTSGTITRTLTITFTSGPKAGQTVTKTMTITFDGTGTPQGSLDGQRFTVDCANHTATPHS